MNDYEIISEALRSNLPNKDFASIMKCFIKVLGFAEAYFLSEMLLQREIYMKTDRMQNPAEFFIFDYQTPSKEAGMSANKTFAVLDNLSKLGVIEKKWKSRKKAAYSINDMKLKNIILLSNEELIEKINATFSQNILQ